MKIVQLVPGSGGTFYCENCLRDVALVAALRRAGHDVLMVPLYLPLAIDQPQRLANAPVFFGGINVYLQQKLGLFRRAPRWMSRLLDSPRLLRFAARRARMTNAAELSETTLSMLRGEQGRQAKELDRLVNWLASTQRPDVVCLSNVLLAGMVRRLKAALKVPVVCMLQDEDIFLDGLAEGFGDEAWRILAERAAEADGFIAVSKYYRDEMVRRLSLPAGRVQVVYNGLDVEGYSPAGRTADPPAVGFLQRMCPQMGLDVLVEAFVVLKSSGRFDRLRLRVAGGKTADDEPYVSTCRKKLVDGGWAADAEFLEQFDRDSRIAFLRSLSVLSVPARHHSAFGLHALEALAAGVPVVLPPGGASAEFVETTAGGVVCPHNDAASLASALEKLLSDPAAAQEMGRHGREAVLRRFTVERMAEEYVAACRRAAVRA